MTRIADEDVRRRLLSLALIAAGAGLLCGCPSMEEYSTSTVSEDGRTRSSYDKTDMSLF